MNAEILKKAQEKIKTFFSGLVTPEEKEALNQWVKQADTSPPAAPAAQAVSYPVDGGNPVFIDISDDGMPDIDVNDKVFADSALTTPCPDGNYKVTGTDFSFTVAAGIVTAVTDPDNMGPGDPVEMKAQKAKEAELAKAIGEKFSAQLSEQKKAYDKAIADQKTAFEKEIGDLKKQVVTLTKHFTKMIETPINLADVNTHKVEKKYSEMSNFEKVRFNRGEKIYHG